MENDELSNAVKPVMLSRNEELGTFVFGSSNEKETLQAQLANTQHRNLFKILLAAKKCIDKNKIPNSNIVKDNIKNEIYLNSAFYDGEIYSEYFGGVLASAKLHNRNDIGQSILKTITRLSSYDLRLHYIFYMSLRKKFLGKKIHLGDSTYSQLCGIYISKKCMDIAMSFSDEEIEYSDIIYDTVLRNLSRENLISEPYSYAKKGFKIDDIAMPEDGLYLIPSNLGATLLLWGMGYGMTSTDKIFASNMDFSIPEHIQIPDAVFWGLRPTSGDASTVISSKKFIEYLNSPQ